MTGFFANLAASVREPAGFVRPRLPSIFEAPSWRRLKSLYAEPDDAIETQAFSESSAVANVTRELPRVRPSEPAAEIRPGPEARPDRVSPAVSLRDPAPEAARKPNSEVEPSREDPETDIPVTQLVRPQRVVKSVQHESLDLRARVDPPLASTPALHPLVQEGGAVSPPPMQVIAGSPTFPFRRVAAAESSAQVISPIEPRIEVRKWSDLAAPTVARLRSAPNLPRRHSISKPAETTIHVSIGKVEVRAAPAPAQQRRSPEKPQVMALDEYLRSRAEGRRQ